MHIDMRFIAWSFSLKATMPAKRIKTLLSYALILAAGSAIGIALPRLYQEFRPVYSTGDYSAHYPDKSTNVVVYGTATCPYCQQARSYLEERQIRFVDIDVNESKAGRQAFVDLGGKAVPVILVGDRLLTGFNKRHLDDALVEAGHPGKG